MCTDQPVCGQLLKPGRATAAPISVLALPCWLLRDAKLSKPSLGGALLAVTMITCATTGARAPPSKSFTRSMSLMVAVGFAGHRHSAKLGPAHQAVSHLEGPDNPFVALMYQNWCPRLDSNQFFLSVCFMRLKPCKAC